MKSSTKLRRHLKKDEILYEHQHEPALAIADDLDAGFDGGVISAPTGIGKTVIMGSVIVGLGERTIVLVPRKLLADQTYDSFTGITGMKPEDVGIYHSGVSIPKKREALNKKVLITTPASYMNLAKRGLLSPEDFGYVTIDEGHRSKGKQTRIAIDKLIENAITHVYTATPKFADGSTIGQILFGRVDYTYELDFKTAVDRGFLTPTYNVIRRTGIDASKIGNPNSELTESQQKYLAMRKGRDEIAIEMSLNYKHEETGVKFNDETSVWYCTGVKHAENVAKKLNEAHGKGYAAIVSGETPKDELKEILKAHKRGDFKAIVNADLLIEGWDNPRASVAYMLRDTTSPVVIMQTGGRVVRIDKNNPDKCAFVVNLVDEGRPNSKVFADVAGGIAVKGKKKKKAKKNWFDDLDMGFDNGKPKDKGDDRTPVDYDKINTDGVIVTDKEYKAFLKRRDDELQRLNPEPKTEEWVAKRDLNKLLGISYDNAKFRSLMEEIEKTGMVDGKKIESGYRRTKTIRAFCIHKDSLGVLKDKLGLGVEEKTGKWKTITELSRLIGTTNADPDFSKFWNEVQSTGKLGGKEVRSGRKKAGSRIRFCVHRDDADIFRKALGIDFNASEIKEKTEMWKHKEEFASFVGIDSRNINYITLWEMAAKSQSLDGEELRLEYRKSGSRPCLCMHVSETDKFREKLDLNIEKKTAEWVGKRALAKLVGTDYKNSFFVRAFDEIEKTGFLGEISVKSDYKKSSGHKVFCIHETEVVFLRRKIEEMKAADKGQPNGKVQRDSIEVKESKSRGGSKERT